MYTQDQNKKAILHVIDTTGPGGAETVFTQLAHSTQQLGFRTIALIRGPGWVQDELSRLGIRTIVRDNKGSFNVGYLVFILQLIRKQKISIIQSHLLGSNVYSSLSGFLTRTPVICTFHGHVDVSPNERFRFLKFFFIDIGCRRVIAVTEQIRKLLTKFKYNRLDNKTEVIANGIDEAVFTSSKDIVKLSKNNLIQLGCLGNVRFAKNYALAVAFVKQLTDEGYKVKLTIAGDDQNTLATDVKSKAKNLAIDDKIEFVGFINDPNRFLSEIDIFLMTSSTEGHPLALTQALSSKTPILTTPSGVEEIVTNDIVFISKNHTSNSLLSAFEGLINTSSTLLDNRVKLGRELVEGKYSKSAMLSRYAKLYGTSNE